MSNLILGIDAGNYSAKVAGPYGVDRYRTAICDWFERDIVDRHGNDDMEFEINGRRGFAGSIAVSEDQFGGVSMYGDSKAHDDTLVRTLLAIYRYTNRYGLGAEAISLVTGQPIATHKQAEKARIIDMLRGRHDIIVNGVKQRIIIEEVGVAAEGSAAILGQITKGTVRIIDIGSGTVNCASLVDLRHINTASGTFNFGMETVDDKNDVEANARGIIRATTTLKWRKSDVVLVCGDSATAMVNALRTHYMNAEVLSPLLRLNNGGAEVLSPVYANAVGYYEIARRTFA